ncbi:MAG: hypothetical protein JST14_03380 [Bacteroidetes bacterium]|nr:hypothetical protein [Bacteroidota bacterium]
MDSLTLSILDKAVGTIFDPNNREAMAPWHKLNAALLSSGCMVDLNSRRDALWYLGHVTAKEPDSQPSVEDMEAIKTIALELSQTDREKYEITDEDICVIQTNCDILAFLAKKYEEPPLTPPHC